MPAPRKRTPPIEQRSMGPIQPTTDAQTTDKQRTVDVQPTDSVPTTDVQQGETPRRQIRIPNAEWIRINHEARERGISASALVRMIIKEWLK